MARRRRGTKQETWSSTALNKNTLGWMKTVMVIHKKIRYNTSFAHFSSCLEWFSALEDDDHTFYESHQNKYITLTRGHWINSIVVGDRINGHPTNAHLHVLLRLHGSSWTTTTTTTGRRHLLTSLRPAACLPACRSVSMACWCWPTTTH